MPNIPCDRCHTPQDSERLLTRIRLGNGDFGARICPQCLRAFRTWFLGDKGEAMRPVPPFDQHEGEAKHYVHSGDA